MKRSLVVALVLLVASPAFAAPPLDVVRRALVGTWQSTQDPRFTREFAADGSMADRYEGDSRSVLGGTWIVFNGDAPPPDAKTYKMIPEATYLEIRQQGDVLVFGLSGLSAQSLKMVYLERGNELSFSRLK